ncbi:MAG: chemotaxis protein CheX [Planctomyces sp.]|jgi:chemotaxis protein CheX|nr:chemotaxis protein CheX [Planctomyces sp.]
MSAAVIASATSRITAEYVNPVIAATRTVFSTMLGATANRTGLSLRTEAALSSGTSSGVSAVIGISGQAAGTLVLNLTTSTAIEVLRRLIGTEARDVNAEVCDAVGEITNMIAGHAKAQLAKYSLSISIPNVVSGADHTVHFPSNVIPMVLSFDSDLGPFTIEVGFSNLPVG